MCNPIDKKKQAEIQEREDRLRVIEAKILTYEQTFPEVVADIQALFNEIGRLEQHLEQIVALAATGIRLGIDQQAPIAIEARCALGYDDFTPTYLVQFKRDENAE